MIVRQLREIFCGVGKHATTKLAWHAAVGAWIAFFYYAPQHWPLFPAQPAPAVALEHVIPFQPAWALVYQSVFIVHTLAFWLPRSREAVKRYAQSLAIAFTCGAVVFWLYPTASPRPEQPNSALHAWLISAVDGTRNAFPSLHAAMGVLAVVTVSGHLHVCGAARWWNAALALWWIALLYSTLATRQHRLLDLVAGLCLGGIAYALPALFQRNPRCHEAIPVSPHQPAVS